MRRYRTPILGLGVLAIMVSSGIGCGDGAAPATPTPPAFKSGTRLRAVVVGHGDAKLFSGWHDAKLDVDCGFRTAEDGSLRCVSFSSGPIVFNDAGCTSAVWINENGVSPIPKFVQGAPTPAEACDQNRLAYPMYAVHEEVQPSQRYRPTKSGGCEPVALDVGGPTFAAEKLAPTEFVAATTATVPLTNELAVTQLAAEDGAEALTRMVSVASSAPCAATEMADGKLRCAPFDDGDNPVAYVTYAEDASCLDRLAYRVVGGSLSCPAPTIELAYAPPGSCAAWLFFGAGEEVKPAEVFHGDQPGKANCVSLPLPPDHEFFRVGKPLDVTTFPAVSMAPLAGKERLTIEWYTAPSGVRLEPTAFWDEKLGVQCLGMKVCKAGLRCLPDAAGLDSGVYGTAECTNELAWTRVTDCGSPPPVLAVRQSGECFDVFQVGAEVHGTVYEQKLDGSCAPLQAHDVAGLRFFEAGAAVDPSTFVALTTSTE